MKTRIKIEVSPGEYFDKLTIIKIKLKNIFDKHKLINIQREWENLDKSSNKLQSLLDDNLNKKLKTLIINLMHVNATIWDIENKIRKYEHDQNFNDEFIKTARLVYITNDKRAALKKEINILFNSDIAEEKSYVEY